ncbi:MAG: NADH-quinone oxidoreductase subunit NuoN [Streptomycetaceae bacterium]|jgi:NADH-quinone oxidoreductase subunit N|nr:MAG: NADH-quinone oxidoreductase subunit NuoN [Streptomycetaceae bacterium]
MTDTPILQYSFLAPILIVLGGAVVGVLVEAFVATKRRASIQLSIALFTIFVSFISLLRIRNLTSAKAAFNSVMIDGPAIFMQGTILLIAFFAVMIIGDVDHFTAQASAVPGSEEEKSAVQTGRQQTEVFPLTLFAVAGMLLFPAASDLITLFVALEVLSLPLYLMAGLSRRRRLFSQEAALKYFLLGAYSSAFFLFGAAFLYGFSYSVTLAGIHAAVIGGTANNVFLLIGLLFVSLGLLFKVGAVPFHAWTPDVYQGAPTPITGFMAAATKVAAFGALLRIFYVTFGDAIWNWRPILTVIAILTMLVGSIVAITQRDIKRMLAYSSIAHAGFLLTGVIALNRAGLAATLYYLLAYGFITIGAFGVITLVRDSSGEITDLNRWAGLGRRSPKIAALFSFFLLAFAGIPLTSGFIGKFAIFTAAYESGNIGVVVVGVLSSAIAAFFYIRVIVMMYFAESHEDSLTVVIPSPLTSIAIWVSGAVTLVLGVYPTPVLNVINTLAIFIR